AAPAPKPRPIANPAAGLGTLLRPLSIAVIAATIIIGFTLGRWAMGLVAQPRAVQTAAPTTAAIAAVTLAPPTRAAPHRVAVRTAPTPRPTNPPSPQPTVTNATAAAAPTAAPPRVESRPSAKPRIASVKPKKPVATPPAQPAAMPAIQRFSATPSTIIAGDISTICVRVADAHKVVVSHLGRFNPAVLGCREVRPSATTVYTVSAINRDGHGTTQSVRLTVKPLSALGRTAQAPLPTP
ncbi:MAG: hypothetical protein ACREM6_09160, partial [Vulcanimicrobiaceae bacterium]